MAKSVSNKKIYKRKEKKTIKNIKNTLNIHLNYKKVLLKITK